MLYKIKIYKHNSVRANIDDDIAKVAPYFKSDFVKSFIKDGIDIQINTEITTTPRQDVIQKLMIPNENKFDCVLYIYEKGIFQLGLSGNWWGFAQNITNKIQGIFLMSDIPSDNVDYTWKSMCHEILHAITYKLLLDNKMTFSDEWNKLDKPIKNGVVVPYYGNELMTLVDGNFAQQFTKISPLVNKPVYKYFKASEIVGLKPELVLLLDKMREQCGFPFKINSGFRSIAKNASLSDAVSDSAHLSGEAVDISITDSIKRNIFIEVLKLNGIVRYGIAGTFIHIDISKTLPQNVCWVYNK